MDPQAKHLGEEEEDATLAGLAGLAGRQEKDGLVEEDVGVKEGEEDGEVPAVNMERRLVIHANAGGDPPEDEEEEFVFEDEDVDGEVEAQWLAVARYYSGKSVKAKAMFSELSNAWGEVSSRDLGDNRFLLEFPSENSLNFVLRGGPWKFRGDALIVVRYDGFTRLSDVVIDSIPLWIRIYDIPVAMQLRSAFMSALGAKVGRVLEIGEAAKDFKRVKVDFNLANVLKPSVQIKVKGMGPMEFEVKYEDVPFFCFWCGRIGHSVRECPEEDLSADEVRFGIDLRASPFKRAVGRQIAIYKSVPAAKRGLNFAGAQREKVTSFMSSSASSGGNAAKFDPQADNHGGGVGVGGGLQGRRRGGSNPRSDIPRETEEELSRQVDDMVVDDEVAAAKGEGSVRVENVGW